MGQFEIANTDDICIKMRQMGDRIDEVVEKMLQEAAPILEAEVRANFPTEIDGYATKLKTSAVKSVRNGGHIVTLNFTGTTKRSKDRLRNMELMAYWEYGSSRNPKTGFLRRSVAASTSEVQAKMTEVLERELLK